MAKQLVRRSALKVELRSVTTSHADRTLTLAEVAWMHRIVWASQ